MERGRLARELSVSLRTIRRAGLTVRDGAKTANQLAIRPTLEAAGVEFIDENGGGPGVRFRRPIPKRRIGEALGATPRPIASLAHLLTASALYCRAWLSHARGETRTSRWHGVRMQLWFFLSFT